jgi:predicted nucleotidyltransferase
MENKDKNIEIAKRIIIEEVEKAGYHVDRIILFGSRARGDYQKGSDYDFLIAIDKDLARNEKINLTSKISLRLSDYIASDIIIKSGKDGTDGRSPAQLTNLKRDCFAALAMTDSRNDVILEFIKYFLNRDFGGGHSAGKICYN